MTKIFVDTSQLQYAPWRAYLISTTPNPKVEPNAFRPKGWAQAIPLTYIDDGDDLWYFDAVFKNDHNLSQKITENPVQTGANRTDHSYSLPAVLQLEIGMSDVMDSFTPSQWGSDDSEPTKSVAAFQKLNDWKDNGTPLNITTRLKTYDNMVIENISALDTIETIYGLRCTVVFKQIFVAEVETSTTNARPAVLNSQNSGVATIEEEPDDSSAAKKILGD